MRARGRTAPVSERRAARVYLPILQTSALNSNTNCLIAVLVPRRTYYSLSPQFLSQNTMLVKVCALLALASLAFAEPAPFTACNYLSFSLSSLPLIAVVQSKLSQKLQIFLCNLGPNTDVSAENIQVDVSDCNSTVACPLYRGGKHDFIVKFSKNLFANSHHNY